MKSGKSKKSFNHASLPWLALNHLFSGDYHKREEPLFQVDLARKDARHMLALAKESGVEMAPVKTIDKHFEAVKGHMGQRGDIAGVYGATRLEAGLPFEN